MSLLFRASSCNASKRLYGPSSRAAVSNTLKTERSMSGKPKIIYTETDEAPALATYALLPIIRRFTVPTGVEVETSDISVSGRVISHFSDYLTPEQRQEDNLAQLGELAKTPQANIIKLPNVSASIPQLEACIKELQSKGYNIPDFPASPKTDTEKEVASRYAKVLGSAVNPVLREGNSDRRAAGPVKAYAQKNPHRMGKWSPDCRSHVAHMSDGDFFSSEQSAVMSSPSSVRIELEANGKTEVLKQTTELEAGEVIDAATMNVRQLRAFFESEMQAAKADNIMVSLHLKATMMKVSDPIMFGHCVSTYFKDAIEKHADLLASLGASPNNGYGNIVSKIATLPESQRDAVQADFDACFQTRPSLSMVDSGRGITGLHVPSDVIIDASMPCVIRDSGKMWNKDDALEDTKCLIPDRCYAGTYQKVIDNCKQFGQFDVSAMGSIPNVGLMAKKAEEYGSHDKTFELPAAGTMRVVNNQTGEVVFTHAVEKGDIWRMCQTKDEPIQDWVRLAVERARLTSAPAVFWLNEERAHDASLIGKVKSYLADHDTTGLEIHIMAPEEAIWFSMQRAREGKDTISVTGNVLRDYLTDLFPILELGTSAKMLSIVPLLKGGGLFETGAGGSAPKHVQQFVKENHLRWDSLGEYLALAVSLEDLGRKTENPRATLLGKTLTDATGRVLDERKSPSRKVKELDNRGSSFYIALFWAEEMAKHDTEFAGLAKELDQNKDQILQDLIDCQGSPVDIGGYFKPDPAKTSKAMRPSSLLNSIIDNIPGSMEQSKL